MAPRPRDPKNSDLPKNLWVNRNIFVYRNPSGRHFSVGADRERAITLAKQLNAHYTKTDRLFDKVVEGDEVKIPTFSELVAEFSAGDLKTLRLSAATLKEYQRMLGHVSRHFAGKLADEITTEHIAKFLKSYPPRASVLYRSLLSLAFKFAKSEGLCTGENPVINTIARRVVVKRERLTAQQYRAIWQCAAPAIRNAMDLALYTLQRREDIAKLRFADNHHGYLWVRPDKVKKYDVALRIAVHDDLAAVIARCRDGMLSPWMVHQPHSANQQRRGKPLSPDSLSRGFQTARDAADHALFPDALPERPTFHEIRALGAKQLRDSGVDPQALLGHRDAKTTRLYLDRHEIRWITVSARVCLD